MNRSIRGAAFVALSLLVLSMAPLATPVFAAGTVDVTSWIEVSSTRPAVGCSVDLGIEIRGGGNAISSTEVSIALFNGEELISADRQVTNGDGIAHLTVETGGASGQGWLDVNVADGYLTGLFIGLGSGGSCADEEKFLTVEGTVPDVQVASSGSSPDGTGGVFVSGIPFYVQQRNLSCEYASLYIATAAYGNGISEYVFDDLVGWSSNPHWGYRGDINGWWGNTTDYGVYAEPLANVLPDVGFRGEVFYTGGDTSLLIDRIDADVPVIVWVGLWGDQSIIDETDGVAYKVTAGMHVVVAYGYDDTGVWVSDPAIGGARHYSWADFQYIWSVMDGMSLAIYQN